MNLNTTKEKKKKNEKIKQQKLMCEIWTKILLEKEGKNQVTETKIYINKNTGCKYY